MAEKTSKMDTKTNPFGGWTEWKQMWEYYSIVTKILNIKRHYFSMRSAQTNLINSSERKEKPTWIQWEPDLTNISSDRLARPMNAMFLIKDSKNQTKLLIHILLHETILPNSVISVNAFITQPHSTSRDRQPGSKKNVLTININNA